MEWPNFTNRFGYWALNVSQDFGSHLNMKSEGELIEDQSHKSNYNNNEWIHEDLRVIVQSQEPNQ